MDAANGADGAGIEATCRGGQLSLPEILGQAFADLPAHLRPDGERTGKPGRPRGAVDLASIAQARRILALCREAGHEGIASLVVSRLLAALERAAASGDPYQLVAVAGALLPWSRVIDGPLHAAARRHEQEQAPLAAALEVLLRLAPSNAKDEPQALEIAALLLPPPRDDGTDATEAAAKS